MTKRLASSRHGSFVYWSLTSQLTGWELKCRQGLSRYFRSRARKTWRAEWLGKDDLEGEEACGLSADSMASWGTSSREKRDGLLGKTALSKLFVLHVSQGKPMQSSSIFLVHPVWVNTFILLEHLTLKLFPRGLGPTASYLLWVVNVSQTSVSSEEKNKPFYPQSEVWYGSFLIAFLSCACLLGKSEQM